MKKIVLVLTVLSILLLIFGCVEQNSSLGEFILINDPEYNFSVQVPVDWELYKGSNNPGLNESITLNAGLYGWDFVSIEQNKDNSTLDSEIVKVKNYRFNSNKLNVVIIEDNFAVLSDLNAYKVVMQADWNDYYMQGNYTSLDIFTIKDGYSYHIIYTAKSEDYAKNIDKINKIVETFKIN